MFSFVHFTGKERHLGKTFDAGSPGLAGPGRANAVLSGGHPQPAPPPDTGPTVQWPTPRRSRRALLAGVLLGLTGLSVAGAVIVSTCTLCYAVSTDGSPPLAYVQGEDTYQTAVRQVEDQVSEILRSDYRYAQETTMALTIAPKNSLQTSDQLTASLMETVDQVKAIHSHH